MAGKSKNRPKKEAKKAPSRKKSAGSGKKEAFSRDSGGTTASAKRHSNTRRIQV